MSNILKYEKHDTKESELLRLSGYSENEWIKANNVVSAECPLGLICLTCNSTVRL